MNHLLLGSKQGRPILTLCVLIGMIYMVRAQSLAENSYHLLIGTYTQESKSDGIYVYEFNSNTGKSSYRTEAKGILNPSFLTVSEDSEYVYSVNEIGDGKGSISSFSFDAGTGKLDYMNSASSGGNGPCYISVDKANKYVFVGNYSGGSLSAVPIKTDGSLGSSIQSIRHEGSSIGTDQDKSHVHAAVLSENNKFLYVPDLGTDKIHVYDVDVTKPNPLKPSKPEYVQVKAGGGPRHYTFHPSHKFAYSIQELTGTVTFFEYDNGNLKTMQSVDLVSKDSNGPADAADIHISPDGKFLYGSLRGSINELVIYDINEKGMLSYVGRQSTLGKGPRNFAIDPTGNFLLVGNGESDEIVVFKRNKVTGLLFPTEETISVGSPVCLKFAPIK